MKINKIKINAFGNLKNKNIELKKINIIYGKNESGKSTLQNFIINMLYGISKNKNGKFESDYDKYNPWSGEEYSGKIEYQLDNNKIYNVYRDFNKKNPEIYDEYSNNISNEFNIDKKLGNTFFIEQTNIDREIMTSTVASMQNETQIDKNTQNLLVQKVANLAESGEEDVSYKKAIAKLDKLLLNEVGTDKSQDRPINIAKNKLNKLNNELDEIKDIENDKYLIEEKNKEYTENLNFAEKNKKIYSEIKNIMDENNSENQKIEIKEKIYKENNEKIEKIKIEKIEKNNKKNKIINYFLLFLILLINILSFIFIKNKIINIIIFLLIPIWILINLIKNKNKNKKIKNNKIQINTLEKNNNELKEEINNLKNKLINKNNEEKNKLINKYGKEIEELFNNNIYDVINNNNNEINQYNLEIHKLKLDLENIEPKLEKMVNLIEEIQIEEENIKKLNEEKDVFLETKEIIENSYEEMKNNVTPKFNICLSEYIDKISGGKYNNIKINDGIQVELTNGKLIPIEKLSEGTIEQIYLALRLSVIDQISKEKLPIFLDETFAYYDDERLAATLKFINSVQNQAIIFTCTNRETEILEQLGIEYNLIGL